MVTVNQSEMLLSASRDLLGNSFAGREAAREAFRKKESNDENVLRIVVDGLIAHLANSLEKIIKDVDEKISYQIGLSASFIRTHFLVMDCVLHGDLIEAVILSRKQLEALARLHEIDEKPLKKIFKRTPNISSILPGEAGHIYGEMSEVAHFSNPRVTELLHIIEDGQMLGPRLYPSYSKHSHACSDMECFVAVYFTGWFLEKLDEWYPSNDYSEEKKIYESAVLLALKCGVLRIKDAT